MFSFVLLFYFIFFLFCPLNFCVFLIPLKYMLTAQTHFIRSEYLGFYAVKKMKKKQQEKSDQEGKEKRKRTGFSILSRFQNTQTVTQYTDYSTGFRILRRAYTIFILGVHFFFIFFIILKLLIHFSFLGNLSGPIDALAQLQVRCFKTRDVRSKWLLKNGCEGRAVRGTRK